jgi:hypothetical protein
MVGTFTKESMVGRPLQFSFDKTHHFFQRGCHLQTLLKNIWRPISYWNCTFMTWNEWLGFLLVLFVCLFFLFYGCKSTFIKKDSLWVNGLLCSCGITHCLSTLLLVLQGSFWCFLKNWITRFGDGKEMWMWGV